jgi:methenyltetrahydrofolate cyclohydrolase
MSADFSKQSISDFLSDTAAKQPTPGGGAVASVVGALAAALAQMVVSYSIGKKSLAAHEQDNQRRGHALENARALLLGLAEEDALAYGAVNELGRLPENDPRRQRELPGAQTASVQVPLAVAAACVDLLRLFESLASTTNPHLKSDLAIAAILADAAARASACNVGVNLPGLSDEHERRRASQTMQALVTDSLRLASSVQSRCG